MVTEISKAPTMAMHYRPVDNPMGKELREFRGDESPVLDGQGIFTRRGDALAESCRISQAPRISQASKCGSDITQP